MGSLGEWQGDCAKDWCEFRIWLDDASHALHRFPVLDGGNWGSTLRWPRWANRPYGWVGGRFVDVQADFEVQHGVIWSKAFAVLITPLPEKYDSRGELMAASGLSVIGQARSSSNCFHQGYFSGDTFFSAANPEICLLVDDDRAHWAIAEFTPFADENTISELVDFNLACITSWKGCRTSKELMPAAASMFERSRRRTNAVGDRDALETLPLWILARDSEYVAVGEASAAPGNISANTRTRLQSFRITKLLKGDHLISGAGIYVVNTEGSVESCPSLSDTRIPIGAKVLMFFYEPLNRDLARESDFSPCQVAPMTDQNLAAAQHGIARDSILRDSAVH